jgi:hypothetical protein
VNINEFASVFSLLLPPLDEIAHWARIRRESPRDSIIAWGSRERDSAVMHLALGDAKRKLKMAVGGTAKRIVKRAVKKAVKCPQTGKSERCEVEVALQSWEELNVMFA